MAVSGFGVTVTFTDVRYTVKLKKRETREIIPNLTGRFEPRRLTALMGPSGSGKTTLMDILAGRKSGGAGQIEGDVLFGGVGVPKGALRYLCGYVEQFDTLLGELTVEQMLMYTAELKFPASVTRAERRQRCEDVIAKLRLETCRTTLIGNPLRRGISGGQAKRVNIALAIVTKPKVLFLDEPTSGLDSCMANEVCVSMKELATTEGCTVVATIHAPSSHAFSLFDDLLMLQANGRAIYAGQVSGVRPHFEALGHKFPVDKGYSLPDWLVDLTTAARSGEGDAKTPDSEEATEDFAALWEKSEACQAYSKSHALALSTLKSSPADLKSLPREGPGQLRALRTLLAYRMTTHYRSGEFLGPRFGDKIFMSILTMTLYWGIGAKTDVKSITSTGATLYFFCALCGYGAAAFVPSLTLERALFYRERADGCYTACVYYLSKFIEEAALAVFTSLTFSVIVFFAMSLQGSFFIFALVYFLTTMVGIVLAYLVAAVTPTMEAANAALPAYVTTCMYFGGQFLIWEQMPDHWYWYSYTSFLRYAWGGLMLNQFHDEHSGSLKLFVQDNGEIANILEFYSMSEGIMSSMGACLAILLGMCLFFGALGAVALTYVSHVKR